MKFLSYKKNKKVGINIFRLRLKAVSCRFLFILTEQWTESADIYCGLLCYSTICASRLTSYISGCAARLDFYFNFYAPHRPTNMCALLVSWNRKWVAAACVHVRRRSYKCHGLYATYWKVCRSTRIFLAHLSRHTIQFQWKNKNTIVSRNRNNEHFSSMRCRFKYAGLGIKANVSQMFSCDGI